MQADIIKIIGKKSRWIQMLIPSLTKSEKAVLLYLADRGEGTRYEAGKEKGLSYSVVHDVFKRFCKRYWIRKDRVEKSDRNIPKVVYRPTVAGLLCAFLQEPENSRIFKRTAEHFPLILRKGDLFERQGAGEIVAKAFLDLIGGLFWAAEKGYLDEKEIKSFTKELFEKLFIENKDEEILKVSNAIAEDRDLRKFVRPVVKSYRKWYLDKIGLMDRVSNILGSSRLPKKTSKGGEKP